MQTYDREEIKQLIYSPSDVALVGTNHLRARRDNKDFGMPIYLPIIDAKVNPAQPGDLYYILGRPGNGKSSFMMRWARKRAQHLAELSKTNKERYADRVVIYCSLEQSIEELHAFNVAADERMSITSMARGEITDDEWKKVLRAGTKSVRTPIWMIGKSMDKYRRRKTPPITVETMGMALAQIEDMNYQIDALFVDYLQRFTYPPGADSHIVGIGMNSNSLKTTAQRFGCPVISGAQARRECDSRDDPTPTLQDAQWASEIEQNADAMFGLMRPCVYRKQGEMIAGMRVQGSQQMRVVTLKQKLADISGANFWVYFDPAFNKMDELEMRYSQ